MKFGPYTVLVRVDGIEQHVDPVTAKQHSPFLANAPRLEALAYALLACRWYDKEKIMDSDVEVLIKSDILVPLPTYFLGVVNDNPYLLSSSPGIVELPLGKEVFNRFRQMSIAESVLRELLILEDASCVNKGTVLDCIAHSLESLSRADSTNSDAKAEQYLEEAQDIIVVDENDMVSIRTGATEAKYFTNTGL